MTSAALLGRRVLSAAGRAVGSIAAAVRASPLLLTAGAVLAAVGLLWLLFGPVTVWATPVAGLTGKDLADVRTANRQTLLAAVGGLAVLAGLAFTARTYYLTRHGQLTDRYTKAIALLASDKPTERLGGIYALEHLMAESDRDHDTVVEVLAAFIRQHPAPPDPDDLPVLPDRPPARPPARRDVQAALTVLGRRPRRPERNLPDLSETDLREMRMDGLHLPGVSFWSSDLRGAVFLEATLTGANLSRAWLQSAQLSTARMRGARLWGARLEMSIFAGANLQVVRCLVEDGGRALWAVVLAAARYRVRRAERDRLRTDLHRQGDRKLTRRLELDKALEYARAGDQLVMTRLNRGSEEHRGQILR